jgi:hypothetical protein
LAVEHLLRAFVESEMTKQTIQFSEEAEALKRSQWPVCDRLAEELASNGHSALPALEHALRSRRLHIRSACLRAIYSIDGKRGKELACEHLTDGAHEVPTLSAEIIGGLSS